MERKQNSRILVFLALVILFQVPLLGVFSSSSSGATPTDNLPYALQAKESFSLTNGSHTNGLFNSTANGIGPQYIQYDPQDNRIYVAEGQTNSVSVLNMNTRTLSRSINVGQDPVWEAYDQNSHLLFTANYQSDNISVISTIKEIPIQTISLNASVEAVAYDQFNGFLYAVYGNSSLSAISVSSYKIVFSTQLASYNIGINGIFLGPNGNFLYITGTNSGSIFVFDINTQRIFTEIQTGTYLPNIAFDTAENTLFTTGTPGGVNQLLAVSLSNYSIVRHVILNANPGPIAFDPQVNRIFVTLQSSQYAYVYNGTSLNQTNSVYTRYYIPTSLVFIPQLRALVYSNTWINDIRFIDPQTMNVTDWIAMGEFPTGAAYDPANGNIYYTTSYHGNISVINPASNYSTVIAGLGAFSTDAAYSPAGNSVYFTYGGDSIGKVNTTLNNATQIYYYKTAAQETPRSIVYDHSNRMLYIANPGTGSVGVFNPLNGTVIKLIDLPQVNVISYDSQNGNIYAINSSDYITEINSSTNTVMATREIPSLTYAEFLLFDPGNDMFYAGGFSMTLDRISPSLKQVNSTNLFLNYSFTEPPSVFTAASYDPLSGYIYVGSGSGLIFEMNANFTILGTGYLEDDISSVVFDNSTGQVIASLYNQGSAVVIAQTTATSQPAPTVPLPFSNFTIISIIAVIAAIVISTAFLVARKRKNNSR